jgi:hypothetical protein
MSDERTERRDASGDDLHTLPPDARALYHHLLHEGAAWRATTPELPRVGERLRERAQQLTLQHQRQPQTDTAIPPRTVRRPTDRRRSISLPLIETGDAPMPQTFARRAGGWLAAIAAVAIVGAVGALLVTASRGGTTAPGSPSAPTVQHGRWVSLDPLAAAVEFDANDLPAIAPSDPRVVYESLAYGIQQGKAGTLRRTDDGGATWHELPIPVPAAHVGHAGFLVSPLAAHTVFLTLIDAHGEDCPPGTAQPMGESTTGGVLCWLQYTSTDGGAHWAMTKLPAPATLTPNITNNSATSLPAALGPDGKARLYAILSCPGAGSCSRLVVSADGGVSWQYADAPLLAAHARNVCSTTADLRGTAVYAVTTVGADCNWMMQQPLALWRSDDAGAHWTRLGALATPNIRGMQVAHAPADGRALLFAAEPRTTQMTTNKVGGQSPVFSADVSDVKASSDGGATWTNAPGAGIPVGLKPYYDIGLLGTLSDGSIVVEFIPQAAQENFAGGTLFAWKPGDAAWRQLAPPLTWEVGALTAVPSTPGAQGPDTLYLVMVNRGSNPVTAGPPTYSFLRYDP